VRLVLAIFILSDSRRCSAVSAHLFCKLKFGVLWGALGILFYIEIGESDTVAKKKQIQYNTIQYNKVTSHFKIILLH
jgi:hypothetical protein